jgi:hypothetical protein
MEGLEEVGENCFLGIDSHIADCRRTPDKRSGIEIIFLMQDIFINHSVETFYFYFYEMPVFFASNHIVQSLASFVLYENSLPDPARNWDQLRDFLREQKSWL